MIKKPKRIIIVPSNDINPLNQLSNTHTLLRCKDALKLWKTNGFDFIVTSGGCYYNKKVQTIPAADIMKSWFVSNEVPEAQIISENKSLDTYTNLHYSLKLLKDSNITLGNLAIVSHWTHLTRIKIILWRNYKIKPVCFPVEYKLSFAEWLHEFFWFFYHFLDKTGDGFLERKIRKMVEVRASS
ncbi:MAG TPA: YdcF family protein [Candidatus Moranbacteria bacterium]|nr:YdcF family protein [Candidatus Moranbacteria bacterium]